MGILSPFDLHVQNSLLHLYSVCGECVDATKLFDEMLLKDVVSWTGLVSGYVKAGLFSQALVFFSKMDVEPNIATLVSVFVACGRLGNVCMGMGLHGLMFKHDFGENLAVGNAVMDMYVKCKFLDEATQVFDELGDGRDAVSWTCIISGLVQCERPKEALEFFNAMQVSGVEPDKVTLASVLGACASLGAIDQGRWVHEYIERKEIEWDDHIGTTLVDMYAKCGCIELALSSFKRPRKKNNISTWNALLGGLAMHGNGKEALDHFEEMIKSGARPNEVTFLAILSACCHSGLVDEGRRQFSRMKTDYDLNPRIEHYGCMVDLLGRAGLLNEAEELIRNMPMAPDVLIWGALLSACKAYGDVDMSQKIQGHLVEMEEESDHHHDSGVYVMLSNIYATNDRWEEVTRIRRLMKKKGIKKSPGSSVIEVDGKAHEFLVGDDVNQHPQQEEIHLVLNMLAKQLL
ncbi:Pentatricopeptide repeat [Macleaya cordata]|uniref:Pentatricopeptide repeat n=1 Tax=Macleaya cordata TaxID=56857 RepID=A0A200QKY8_MACCD|nr:Pentatricopeptide repeat [Macleaya cordata]